LTSWKISTGLRPKKWSNLFHLGIDVFQDTDNTLYISSNNYIEKMVKSYKRMLGEALKQNFTSPLEKGDHPEIDTSELLDAKGIQRMYQSMIGTIQWAIIAKAVITISSFRIALEKGT
jgi:hypothetical protein